MSCSAAIGRLTAEGVGVIYISHRLEEIEWIADRMTVMRDGRVIATLDRGAADQGELIRLMVGRQLSETFPRRGARVGEEMLRVEGLSVPENVHDVSFSRVRRRGTRDRRARRSWAH